MVMSYLFRPSRSLVNARSMSSLLNGPHAANTFASPLDSFKPKDNSIDTSHITWDATWKDEAIKEAIANYGMATWGSNNSLQDVLVLDRGEGVYLYDSTGKQYVDLTSQAVCANLGHTVPDSIRKAISDQLDRLPFVYSGLGLTEARARLCNLLSMLCPGDISGFLFPSSGGEANEAAITMARRYTGKTKILNHYRSYHGGSGGAIAATGDFRRQMSEAGQATGFIKMMGPYPWHYNFGATEEEVADNCLAMLQDQIAMEGPSTIAAIMMEGVVGSGGVFRYPTKYVQGVRALCDKHGILLIMDEVMSGFGRTGKWWGFQHYEGVVPDIMTSAKGLSASVVPLAMVGVSSDIKKYFDTKSPGWGSTFHAHPVSMACAFATMKHMVDTDTVGHVQRMDAVLKEEVLRMIEEHPSVARGRSHGLFACLDIINPDGNPIQNMEGPPAPQTAALKAALRKHGVFNFLRLPLLHIAPPLVITEEELRDATRRVSAALAESIDKDF